MTARFNFMKFYAYSAAGIVPCSWRATKKFVFLAREERVEEKVEAKNVFRRYLPGPVLRHAHYFHFRTPVFLS